MRVTIENLESRIERIPFSGCWIWVRACSKAGYGQTRSNKTAYYMHRLSWQLYKGEIPIDRCVLHRCDVPSCVNPDHLFLGSKADNSKDMVEKGRHHAVPVGSKYAAKLTVEQVRVIRADKRMLKDIASDFNTSISNVSMIRLRRTWK